MAKILGAQINIITNDGQESYNPQNNDKKIVTIGKINDCYYPIMNAAATAKPQKNRANDDLETEPIKKSKNIIEECYNKYLLSYFDEKDLESYSKEAITKKINDLDTKNSETNEKKNFL